MQMYNGAMSSDVQLGSGAYYTSLPVNRGARVMCKLHPTPINPDCTSGVALDYTWLAREA